MRRRQRVPAAVIAAAMAAILLAACGDDTDGDPAVGDVPETAPPAVTEPRDTPAPSPDDQAEPAEPAPQETPTPEGPETPGAVDFRPVREHTVFDRPVEVGPWPPAAPTGVYVVEQRGLVYLVEEDESTVILDVTGHIGTGGNEEGLLSLVPDLAIEENGYVWLYFSAGEGPRRTVLARYEVASDGVSIDPASELVVLEVAQPFTNHNGGAVRFGPDGMLYVGTGDGGAGGDPQGHGQNTQTLLGVIVRIDVSEASEAEPYRVPDDNPFVDDANVLDEIWAYGLRNPWRMNFDPITGALWVGDVGQADVEEVSIAEAGDNLGWAIMEGDQCHPPGTDCDPTGLKMPLITYDNASGRCSVTGGVVYRGEAVPELTNAYLFSDWCSGEIWAVNADDPSEIVTVTEGLGRVTSFGVGPDGAIYVVAFERPLQQLVSP